MDDQLLQLGTLLWRASWQGAVLALVVFGLIALLGRWLTPAWRYGLWLVVLARLALPVVPTASWSVWRLADAMPVSASTTTPIVNTPENIFPKQEFVTVMNSYNAQVPVGEWPTPATQPFNWAKSIMWLWLVGTTVGIGWFTITWLRLRRQISASSAIVDPRIEVTLKSAAKTAGLSRVPSLREIPTIAGPAAFGVLQPVILMPHGLAEQLSDRELHDALVHECTHLRRHDVAAVWLATATLCLHWWNPLAWLALRRLRTTQEIACDATVLRLTAPNQHHHYATSIVRLAAFAAGLSHPHLTARASGARRELLERITMIHHPTTPTRRLLTTGALLTMTMAGLVLLDAPPRIVGAESQPSTPVPVPRPNVEAAQATDVDESMKKMAMRIKKLEKDLAMEVAKNLHLQVQQSVEGNAAEQLNVKLAEVDAPAKFIDGAVAAVRLNPQGQQDLVMVTIGKGKKVEEGIEFIVYRGNTYIVKVRAVKLLNDMVACQVIADSWNDTKQQIQQGDLVSNRNAADQPIVKLAEVDAPAKFIDGAVAAVRLNPQGQQDLVMVTIGKGKKVEEGIEFIVYRGNTYIVKVRAVKLLNDMVACQVIVDSWNDTKQQIQQGDLVSSRP